MSATATRELNQTSYRDQEGTEYHFWALTTGDMVVMEPDRWERLSGQRLRNRLKVKASHTEWAWLVNSQTGGIHPALIDTVETGKIHFVGPRHKRAAT